MYCWKPLPKTIAEFAPELSIPKLTAKLPGSSSKLGGSSGSMPNQEATVIDAIYHPHRSRIEKGKVYKELFKWWSEVKIRQA
jgi:hypothetical protein